MNILVVCQHYWPEPYPLTDICEELVKRGHNVHIVTDVPNYPMGVTYDNYKNKKNRKEEHNGVKITRTFTIARRKNAVFRFLNYYSYTISSSFYTKRLRDDYDVVFTNQTSPVMMSTAAFAYAKKHGKKVAMYCMDLWPACLAAGGINETSIIYKLFGRVSKKIYNKADKILITSQMFSDYLVQQHGVDNNKIEYLPQYALAQFDDISAANYDKKTIDLMFAGNVGAAQNLETVIEAAELLKEYSALRWHIVGDGSELENLKELVKSKNLDSVVFYGRKPPEQMPQLYAMADAMLATLTADKFISLTLPAKVQTYMAAEKPIIACANGEIAKIVSKAECGFCAKPENAKELAKVVEQFLKLNHAQRKQLGQNAKKYYRLNFTRKKFMDTLEECLEENVTHSGNLSNTKEENKVFA